jgi:hypothetical protein
VELRGVLADAEALGDLPVREPLAQELQDLALARRERLSGTSSSESPGPA